MRDKPVPAGVPPVFLHVMALIAATFIPVLSSIPSSTQAQTPPITPSGLNTQVSGPIAVGGKTQYNITGGTRPGGGTNLFQSFGNFNVPNNNIANFLNSGSVDLAGNPLAAGLPTSNILGRVTGGNPSTIFGTIQTNGPGGFGNANLFLMNPAGFLFGPNATVNVGGMVAFTTADYLRLADNARFNAIPNAAADALLSTAPVAAYGFLGSNPGAITVQGSQFSVADGTGISLVGGNITIQSGTPDGGTAQPARLSAPNGKIQLASAASPGEFDATTLQSLPNVDGASFTSFGSVSLSPGSNINVSGANTVSIRGGQFVLSVNDSVLSTADTAGPSETISLSPSSSIVTSNSGADPGADIQIIAGNLQMNGASIQSLNAGDGVGGNISIGGQTVSLVNGAQIVSSTTGAGDGGNITLAATDSVSISGFDTTGTLSGVPTFFFDPNTGAPLVTSGVFSTASAGGNGGSISITAPVIAVDNAGTIATINAGDGRGGDVTLNGGTISLTNGGQLLSATGLDFSTFEVTGTGQGGDITVTGTDSILVSGSNPDLGALSNIQSVTYSGNGGNLRLSAPNVAVQDGAIVVSDTEGSGTGGNINIFASNQLSLSGTDPSGNFSQIASFTGLDAQGGTINVEAGSVSMTDLAQISSQSFGSGNPGDLTFQVQNTLSVTGGAAIFSVAPGTANSSGNIAITADRLFISGGEFPSESKVENVNGGGGATGMIDIRVRELVLTDNARINSEGARGQETITISATESVTVSDGAKVRISNNEGGQPGPGGLLEITAPSITLDQGILQTLTQGAGSASAINLRADNLTLSGGFINSATQLGSGRGGDVTVAVTDKLAISGRFNGSSTDSPEPAGIYTSSQFSAGDAGRISVSASTLELSGGARIDSSTSFGSGKGGAVTANADNLISLTGPGTGIFSQASGGTGGGGAITLLAPQVQLADGAIISAISTGSGAAGSVTIEGLASPAQSVLIDGAGSGLFTTTSGTGAGGNIFVNANTVTLQNGGTLSAATSGTAASATGGAITVEGTTVQLNSAATITTATSGPAGNAGDILVKADTFSMNGGATITAASTGSGNAGNVTIQGLASPAQSVLIDGAGSGVFTSADGTGAGGSITIESHQVQLSNSATISAKTTGAGNAGNILVKADSVSIESGAQLTSSSVIGDSGEIPTGNAGNITIQGLASPAQSVVIDDGAISTETQGEGAGGNIFINASTVTLQNGASINAQTTDTGNAGNILVMADTVNMSSGAQITSSSTFSGPEPPTGNAGDITLNASQRLNVFEAVIASNSESFDAGGTAGRIQLISPVIDLHTGVVSASTDGLGNGGDIIMQGTHITLSSNSSITTTTQGQGQGGNIVIQGLAGPGTSAQEVRISQSALRSDTIGVFGDEGPAGNIKINAAQLMLTNASDLSTSSSFSPGRAGTIVVNASELVNMTQSRIRSTSDGELLGGTTNGNAGTITITTPILMMNEGASLTTATGGTGRGGQIVVTANQVALNSGAAITASTTGAGAGGSVTIGTGTFASDASTVSSTAAQAQGGDITITAGQSVTLNNGSSISASSSGPGNAGNILINAGQNYTSTNSAVTTQAAQASGGNITLLATGTVQLTNSQLNASVQGSSTTVGGNITIDPQYVILLNSQILAQATQGQGGVISINITNGGLYLPDANSTVSASSQFGVDGIVTIQSPNAPAGGKIIPLSQKPLLATSLLNQRCASLAGGEFSSFTVAGRDSLPTEPGGWLASPMALSLGRTGGGTLAEKGGRAGIDDDLARDSTILSLRQIAPPGFLTQAFAVDWSAGCGS